MRLLQTKTAAICSPILRVWQQDDGPIAFEIDDVFHFKDGQSPVAVLMLRMPGSITDARLNLRGTRTDLDRYRQVCPELDRYLQDNSSRIWPRYSGDIYPFILNNRSKGTAQSEYLLQLYELMKHSGLNPGKKYHWVMLKECYNLSTFVVGWDCPYGRYWGPVGDGRMKLVRKIECSQ